MPSNVTLNSGTGGSTALTKQLTHDGDTTQCQGVHLLGISGTEDAYTAATINGDATNGLDVDVTRVIPGTTATALGKAEDDAAASGDAGVAVLTVRQDAPVATTSLDGDYQNQKTDSVGRLWVNGSGVTQPVSGTVTANLAAGTNNIGDVDVLTLPALPAGTNNIGDVDVLTLPALPAGTNNIGDVDVLSVVPGTGTTNLGKAEDDPAASGDVGVALLTRRQDALVTDSSLDGDYQFAKSTAGGRLYTSATVDAALPAGTNNIGDVDVLTLPALPAGTNNIGDVDVLTIAAGDNNIGNVDIVTMPNVTLAAGTNTNEVVGDAAHDAAIAGNPLRIAGRARTSDYTSVANDDTADIMVTLNGKQVTQPYAIPENTWNYAAAAGGIVNTTGVSARAAQAAGIRNYVTRAQIINGHATVSTDVQIRDGAAGTVLWRGFAQAAGGGVSCDFDPPLRGTAATLVEIACGTTGSAVYFNLQGYSGP